MSINHPQNRKCMVCSAQWNHDEWFRKCGHLRCPNCNSNVTPMDTAHNGFIEINWCELVMLATYAKRWTKMIVPDSETGVHLLMAFENIIKRLEKYQPKGMPALYPQNDSVEIKVEKSGIEPAMVGGPQIVKPHPDGRILSPFYQPRQPPTTQ